jgi:hypothetical protein
MMKLCCLKHFRIQLDWYGAALRDWILRWVYAQHNARIIIDFESRMTTVIWAATDGMMSKPYYSAETMLAEIADAFERVHNAAYAEGRADALEEHGVEGAAEVDDVRLPCPCGEPGCMSPVRPA